jgi:hypothetical protein
MPPRRDRRVRDRGVRLGSARIGVGLTVGVRKGQPWGRPATAPADVTVHGGDAEIAAAVATGGTGVRIALAPGSPAALARAIGLAGGGGTAGPSLELPCDALSVTVDGVEHLAVNIVVVGTAPDHQRPWTRSSPLEVTVDGRVVHDGPATAVVVGSGQYVRGADLIPRGHPGDGRAEVQV